MRSIFKKTHKTRRKLTLGHIALHGARKRVSRIWQAMPVAFLLLLFVGTLIFQSLSPFIATRSYELSDQVRSLTGESRDDTNEYLKLNEDSSGYSFSVPETEQANAVHTGRIADAYSANLSANPKDGITVTEKNSKIAVTLIPDFYTQTGQKVEGDHIVYPSGPDKLVYTLKYNGLKEDIIVPEYRADELNYKFTLRLPSGAEARLDEQGNIGIYSSDPTLFGDISFGSDEDRERVERARENGEKNHLVMTIPYPIIKDATGQEYTDRSSFELGDKQQSKNEEVRSDLPPEIPRSLITTNDYQLTIKSQNLKDLAYPIAIDPTMRVNDANDFEGVGVESGIDIDTTDSEIKRSGLSGGAVNTWGTTTALPQAVRGQATTTHNGFIYVLGGSNSSTWVNTVYYAKLVDSGGVAPNAGCGTAWCSTSSFPTARGYGIAATHGGYIYFYSGYNDSGPLGLVHYAPINSSGSIGAWSVGTSLPAVRYYGVGLAYNGYLYSMGGCSAAVSFLACTAVNNDVRFAQIRADGSIGAWGSTTSFTTARFAHNYAFYNGYVYIAGGCASYSLSNCNTELSDVRYAKIQPDGTISSWLSTTSLATALYTFGMVAHKGYVYVYGGTAAGNNNTNAVRYSQINSDGTIGSWQSTTNATSVGTEFKIAGHGDHLYSAGGSSGGSQTAVVGYSALKSAGWASSFSANTAMGSTSKLGAAASGNGFLYDIGGCTASSANTSSCLGNASTTTVRYATVSNTGTLTWGTTTALPAGRWAHQAIVHRGFIYVIGGCLNVVTATCTSSSEILYNTINSNGTLGGSWSTATGSANNPLMSNYIAYGDYLISVGGNVSGGGTPSTAVRKYLISGNGDVGAPSSSGVTQLSSANYNSGIAINGNRIYYFASDNNVITATVDSAGNVSSWTSVGGIPSPLDGNRSGDVMFSSKGFLYASGNVNTFYAKINSDGTLAGWTALPSLATARQMHGIASVNDYFVAWGGCTNVTAYPDPTCGSSSTNTESATINNGGSGEASSMTTSGSNLATARTLHTVVAAKGFLYAAGGCTNNTCTLKTASVEKTKVNDDGTLAGWNLTGISDTSSAHYRHASVYINGYLYIIGGLDATNNPANVEFTQVNDDGSFSSPSACGTTWCTTTGVPSGNASGTATIYNGRIYLIRGSSTTQVYYVQPNSDGTLPAWTAATSTISARDNASAVAYGGYLYVLSGNYTYNEYASIDPSTGALGAWKATSGLPITGVGGFASALNGFIYYSGGSATGNSNLIFRAPILQTGELGSFGLNNTRLSLPRNNTRGAIVNGRLYAVAGNNGATVITSTDYASLQSIPRIGSFTRRYDFGSGVKPTKLITRGTKQLGASVNVATSDSAACGATAYDAAVNNPGIGYGGDNGLDINIGASQTLAQCLLLRYTIDDTQSAVFPDEGNESTITDFDLYFTANPGSRLRGGRTFSNGSDRGLDAAPQ